MVPARLRPRLGGRVGPTDSGTADASQIGLLALPRLRGRLGPLRRDPIRDGFVVAAALWCLAIACGVVGGVATDAAGWYRYRLPDPYAFRDYSAGYGFYFTPLAAFAIYPLLLLPWPLFAAVWTGLMFGALYFLVGRWAGLAILFPPVWWELHAGNISLLLAASALVMVRYPMAGSFLLLTKITPAIGLIWFVARGEWRRLGTALLAVASMVVLTLVVAPALWEGWFASLSANVGNDGPPWFVVHVPLVLRVIAAGLLVAWGGRTDVRWTLPVAVTIAVPVLWFNALAGLVGVVRAAGTARLGGGG